MTENISTSLLELPAVIVEKICQMLIDSNYMADSSPFRATSAVRNLQLTCAHFYDLIKTLILRVPILISTAETLNTQEQFCRFVTDQNFLWKINKIYFHTSCTFSCSLLSDSLNRIKPVVDKDIKLLHVTFWYENAMYIPQINTIYDAFCSYFNPNTRIIIERSIPLENSELVQIGFPKIDALWNVTLDDDNLASIKRLGVRKLGLCVESVFPVLNRSYLFHHVTMLGLEFNSTLSLDNKFIVNTFPSLEVLELIVHESLEVDGGICLPESCEAVKVPYSVLKYLTNCENIKYMSLYDREPWEGFFESDLLQSLKFSLYCLKFEFIRGSFVCSEAQLGFRRLFDRQLELKILSIDFYGAYSNSRGRNEELKEFVKSYSKDLADLVREKRPDVDLVIWRQDLVAINRNLTSQTIKKLDKIDMEYYWQIRSRGDEAVCLDPANAGLILPF